ncbi:hypothetical protein [Gloeocapsopsis sp. IPPAS B-1203]|uniref:hypothetical protein n=1 Tax=Gloeocapsopsis sp. IPPAS B-1203 TaxID=2049454 RepID=UPI0025A1CDCD|nr:hypothetical protein [Gloeocapsopsis sp. IPPAS B-1203]
MRQQDNVVLYIQLPKFLGEHHQASGISQLLRDRRIVIFGIAVILFHFAEA